MAQFKVGDVVQLRSGGPPMTIAAIRPALKPQGQADEDWADCRWFDEKNKPQSDSFPCAILQEYEPPAFGIVG